MLASDFTVDLKGLRPEVARRVIGTVRDEGAARHALGLVRQRRMKQLLDNAERVNGGELRQNMIVDETQWIAFMAVYGQRCWSDPDFRKWLQKQDAHRDLFVKDTGTRIQSGYTRKPKK